MVDRAAREASIRERIIPRLSEPLGTYIDRGELRVAWLDRDADAPAGDCVCGGLYDDGTRYLVMVVA